MATQEDIKNDWRRGYSTIDSSKYTLHNNSLLAIPLNLYEEAKVKTSQRPNYSLMSDRLKNALLMHDIFIQMYGADAGTLLRQKYADYDDGLERLLEEEINIINRDKVLNRFKDNDNLYYLETLSPKALAALDNAGYATRDEMIKSGIDNYINSKKTASLQLYSPSITGAVYFNSGVSTYDPSKDDALNEENRNKTGIDNIPLSVFEKNQKALDFARLVNAEEIAKYAENDTNLIRQNILRGKEEDKEKVPEDFNTIAKAINPLYALTGDLEYRNKAFNDDLWNTLIDKEGNVVDYDTMLDMVSEFYAMNNYDSDAAALKFNNRLQDIADLNASKLSEGAKLIDRIGHLIVSNTMIAAGGINALGKYISDRIIYGEDYADMAYGAYMMGKKDGWTLEKEDQLVEQAKQQFLSSPEAADLTNEEKQQRLRDIENQVRDSWEYEHFLDMNYWTKVGQYATFKPNQIKRIDREFNGISERNYIDPSTGPDFSTKVAEGAEMASLIMAQGAMMRGIGLASKGVSATYQYTGRLFKAASNLVNAGNRARNVGTIAYNAIGKLGNISQFGAETFIPLSLIGSAYAYGNLVEGYTKNTEQVRNAILKQSFDHMTELAQTEEGQNWIRLRASELQQAADEKYEDPSLNPMPPESYLELAYNDFIYNSPQHDQYVLELRTSPLYQQFFDDALRSAASAATFDATIETLKYAPVRATFFRWMYTPKTANMLNNFDRLKTWRSNLWNTITNRRVSEVGGIETRTLNIIGKALDNYAHPLNAALIGGGLSNYTDELASSLTQTWNATDFEEGVDKIAQNADQLKYSSLLDTTDALVSAMTEGFAFGLGSTGYQDSYIDDLQKRMVALNSIDAFTIGFLGTMIAPTINPRFFSNRANGYNKGSKRLILDSDSSNYGLYAGKNINTRTGKQLSDNIFRRVGRNIVGPNGLITTGFIQAVTENSRRINLLNNKILATNALLNEYRKRIRDTYGIIDDLSKIGTYNYTEYANDFETSAGIKVASLMSKLAQETSGDSETYKNFIALLKKVTETEVDDIEDIAIQGKLKSEAEKKKIQEGTEEYENLKHTLKSELRDKAVQALENFDKVEDTYDKVNRKFGNSLTEDEKHERVYRELMLWSWENKAMDMDARVSGVRKPFLNLFRVDERVYPGEKKDELAADIKQYENDIKRTRKDLKDVRDRKKKALKNVKDGVALDTPTTMGEILREEMSLANEEAFYSRILEKAKAKLNFLNSQHVSDGTLTAEEILRLSPSDRAFIFEHQDSYSEEQRKAIDEAGSIIKNRLKELGISENPTDTEVLDHIKYIRNLTDITKRYKDEKLSLDLNMLKSDILAENEAIKGYLFMEHLPKVKEEIKSLDTFEKLYAYIYNADNLKWAAQFGIDGTGWRYAKEQLMLDKDPTLQKFKDLLALSDWANKKLTEYDIPIERDLYFDDPVVKLALMATKQLIEDGTIQTSASVNVLTLADFRLILEDNADIIGNKTNQYVSAINNSMTDLVDDSAVLDYINVPQLLESLKSIIENRAQAPALVLNDDNSASTLSADSNSSNSVPRVSVNPDPVIDSSLPEGSLEKQPINMTEERSKILNKILKKISSLNTPHKGLYIEIVNKVLERFEELVDNGDLTLEDFIKFADAIVDSNLSRMSLKPTVDLVNDFIHQWLVSSSLFSALTKIDFKPSTLDKVREDFQRSTIRYITGDGTPVSLAESKKYIIVPKSGMLQSYNMVYGSQFDIKGEDYDGSVYKRFIKYGGQENLNELKLGDTIHFLAEKDGDNVDIWMAVEATNGSLNTISADGKQYKIVGLLSKDPDNTNKAIRELWDAINALVPSDTSNGFTVIKDGSNDLISTVLEKYVPRNILLNDKDGRSINRGVVEVLQREGLSRDLIIAALTEGLSILDTLGGSKTLYYGERTPVLVRKLSLIKGTKPASLGKTLVEYVKGILEKDPRAIPDIVGFNNTFEKTLKDILHFFWGGSSTANPDDAYSDVAKRVRDGKISAEEIATNFKNVISNTIYLNANSGVLFDVVIGDEKLAPSVGISMKYTNAEGSEVSVQLTPATGWLMGQWDSGLYTKLRELVNTMLKNLLFDNNNELRVLQDGNRNVGTMQINYDIATAREGRPTESLILRLVDDDLLFTNSLFMNYTYAGFTATDPLNTTVTPEVRVTEANSNTSALISRNPNVDNTSVSQTSFEEVKSKMEEAYDKRQASKKELKDAPKDHMAVTTIANLNVNYNSNLDPQYPESPKTFFTTIGNNVDKFLRNIAAKIIHGANIASLTIPSITNSSALLLYKNFTLFLQEGLPNLTVGTNNGLGGLTPVVLDGLRTIVVEGELPVKNGETVVGKMKIQGEIDLLTKDSNGQYLLFDFKVVFGNDLELAIGTHKEVWKKQLGQYAKFLKENYGIDVGNRVYIIPILGTSKVNPYTSEITNGDIERPDGYLNLVVDGKLDFSTNVALNYQNSNLFRIVPIMLNSSMELEGIDYIEYSSLSDALRQLILYTEPTKLTSTEEANRKEEVDTRDDIIEDEDVDLDDLGDLEDDDPTNTNTNIENDAEAGCK